MVVSMKQALHRGALCALLMGCAGLKKSEHDAQPPVRQTSYTAKAYIMEDPVEWYIPFLEENSIEISGNFHYIKGETIYNDDSSLICRQFASKDTKGCTYDVCKSNRAKDPYIRASAMTGRTREQCDEMLTPKQRKHLAHVHAVAGLAGLDRVGTEYDTDKEYHHPSCNDTNLARKGC